MNLVDNARKTVATTVSNPKPFYFAAGVGDAAVEALKDAPARLTVASARAGEVATSVAGRVAGVAETVQSKIALGQWQDDAKALRGRIAEPDLRAAREKAQTLLLTQVGRALEVAGKAVETYDGYSERGKAVVERVLSGRVTEVEVVTVEHERAGGVTVESVTVLGEKAEDKPQENQEKAEPNAEAPLADAATPAQPAAPKAEQPKLAAKTAARKTAARAKKVEQA
jgi:heparin binding hemagglutinin HbhA